MVDMNSFVIRTIFNLVKLKNISKCSYSTTKKHVILDELQAEDKPAFVIEPKYNEDEIRIMRNKSRLNRKHENILNNKKPYDQSVEWYHDSVWYRRRMLGRYGIEAANVSPAIAWPTIEEIEDVKEKESLLYPHSIHEALKEIKEKKEADAQKIIKREQEISKVIEKFDEWKLALKEKIKKKTIAKYEARAKKQKSLEEIKEKYGYNINQRDARVKELLLEQAIADKKKKKQQNKEQKTKKIMEFIQKQHEKEIEEEKADK
ncbi:PREDICTED: uncharacterized protein LOC105362755 [Ceratosolen solmsi marchali]|uniref:Large ribosomal subunit protein mL64 n=1 Tax=Ceratosolen solmsi marchali TaxID=326594 RepID=A0AAJ6YI83_9HYME|nr:PREDICTED: uncharacterized protein LOC105362755 [Ceratosolen solmsi marchali]